MCVVLRANVMRATWMLLHCLPWFSFLRNGEEITADFSFTRSNCRDKKPPSYAIGSHGVFSDVLEISSTSNSLVFYLTGKEGWEVTGTFSLENTFLSLGFLRLCV